MIETNIPLDFLLAGLFLLLFDLFHYRSQRKLKDIRSSMFFTILLTTILKLFIGVIRNVWMEWGGVSSSIARCSMTILLILQALLHFEIFVYGEILHHSPRKELERVLCWAGVPVFLGILFVSSGYWGTHFFTFTQTGSIIFGPLYKPFYSTLLIFDLLIVARCILYRKEMGKRNCFAIMEFTAVLFTCVFLHIYAGVSMLTWYGTALGLTFLYLSLNSPSSYLDEQTQVFNRKYFEHWSTEQIEQKTPLYILVVELNQLKHIQTLYGILLGNALLQSVAEALWELAPEHKVFRSSADRFIVCTDSRESYETLKNHILALFERQFILDNMQLQVSALVCGIARAETIPFPSKLPAYSDYLFTLSAEQKNCRLIEHNVETQRHFLYEKEIEYFLEIAIDNDLFEVWYQPIYSLEAECFVSLEALSRLQHPGLGYIPPDIFIRIAERNGKITKLGYLQFQRICRFLQCHGNLMNDLKNIKINLSPLELLEPGYCSTLIKTIEMHNLPFTWFQFEITETVATEYTKTVFQAIETFSSVGIHLSLDDFGSGYANLNTILNLPFSVIKLDRSLLQDICKNEKMSSFYQILTSILQSMGYEVIAEGVEHEEEITRLRKWNVNMVQGYYFAPPVPPDKVSALLQK